MQFYQAELEMREAVEDGKTLEDFVRIGFSHVKFKSKKHGMFLCYEMIGDHTVESYPMYADDPMVVKLDGAIKVRFSHYDTDCEGFTVIEVEEE